MHGDYGSRSGSCKQEDEEEEEGEGRGKKPKIMSSHGP